MHSLDNSILNVDVSVEYLVIIDYTTSFQEQAGLGALKHTADETMVKMILCVTMVTWGGDHVN